ncbi:hypothetical protein [Paenibacillus sp. NPDC057934]
MAGTKDQKGMQRESFKQWRAKNHIKQGKSHPFRGAAVMTLGKKRTNKG